MLFKYARMELKQSLCGSLLSALRFGILFLILSVCCMLVQWELREYHAVQPLLREDGWLVQYASFTASDTNVPLGSSEELNAELEQAHALSLFETYATWYQERQRIGEINIRLFDAELSAAFTPVMKEGRWLLGNQGKMQKKTDYEEEAGEVDAVVTENKLDLKAGDVIEGWLPNGKTEPLRVRIIGVIRERSTYLGDSIPEGTFADFRVCFDSVNRNEPMLFLDKMSFDEAVKKLEPRQEKAQASLGPSTFVLFDESCTGENRSRSLDYLRRNVHVGTIIPLQELYQESRAYVRILLAKYIPLVLLSSMLSVIGTIVSGLRGAEEHRKYIKAYRICGVSEQAYTIICGLQECFVLAAAFAFSVCCLLIGVVFDLISLPIILNGLRLAFSACGILTLFDVLFIMLCSRRIWKQK